MTRRALGIALELWLPVALVAAWWALSSGSTSPYFPPLRDIVETFADTWLSSHAESDLLPSLRRFAVGLSIGVAVGIAGGVVTGRVRALREMTDPVFDFLRALPAPALLPIVILLLGTGSTMNVFLIAFGTLWPVLLNTTDGVRSVEEDMLAMSEVYSVSRRDRLLRIVLPAASPQIFVGLRLAVAFGLVLMILSEMIGSTEGLGAFLLNAQQTFEITEMWAAIFMLGLLGYAVNIALSAIEWRALRWHRGARSSALDGGATP